MVGSSSVNGFSKEQQ